MYFGGSRNKVCALVANKTLIDGLMETRGGFMALVGMEWSMADCDSNPEMVMTDVSLND